MGVSLKKEKAKALVENVTWRHYSFYVIHMLQSIAAAVGGPVMTQYLYHKIGNEHLRNITKNSSHHASSHCTVNKSSFEYRTQQEVQATTARWHQWFSLASGIPMIIVILLAGSWSDVLGRKIIVFVNMVGHLMKSVSYAVVIFWQLETAYLFAGYVIDGLSGGFLTNILMTYAYTADITPEKERRATVIVVVSNISYICFGAVLLGTGYFIRAAGYLWPMMTSIILSVLLIAAFMVITPETLPRGKLSDLSIIKSLKRVSVFYTKKDPGQSSKRRRFWLCLLAFATLSQCTFKGGLDTLYYLNSPFCWDSVKLGQYGAVMSFVNPVVSIATLKILQCFFTTELIGAISLLFYIVRSLLEGFAYTDWMLYVCEYRSTTL